MPQSEEVRAAVGVRALCEAPRVLALGLGMDAPPEGPQLLAQSERRALDAVGEARVGAVDQHVRHRLHASVLIRFK